MQEKCPPLRYDYPAYYILQHVLTCVTTPLNLLSIYCIICKSPKNIGDYKWHLLWHQILAAIVDIELGLFALPIYLLPFPLIAPNGLLLFFPFISTHFMVIFTFLLVTGSLAAVVQLFVYRYLKATGRTKMPLPFICLIVFTYLLFTTPAIGFELIFDRNQDRFFRDLRKNYSCISSAIVNLPQIVGYPTDRIGLFVGLPILIVNLYMAIVSGILIYATRRYLKGNTISAHTALLERRFLFNLIIQVLVPIVAVHGPGLFLMFVQANQIYGFEELGLVCIVMLSVYGAMCSLMIILLTPRYRNFVLCRTKRCSVSSFDNPTSKVPIQELKQGSRMYYKATIS